MNKQLSLPIIFFLTLLKLSCYSQNKTGFIQQQSGSLPGYILFAPLHSKTTYLIDKCGKQVHSWKSNYTPGQSVYLLENGDLLRTANDSNKVFKGGGIIELYDWNNTLKWSYSISNENECQHHDICPLPNGNILVLVWEKRSRNEALLAGRNPALLKGEELWTEKIIELKPKGKNAAKIVWQWNAWDHLVQEFDSLKKNYGSVRENPQLIHINYAPFKNADWLHFNSISYNAELDQILISSRNFSEIFILDHSTSTKKAASHKGGKYKKGGDLLYRFGNPAVYNGGTESDQKLFGQHSPYWIEKGFKDAGAILLFNNGMGRRSDIYSSVDILVPPLLADGTYTISDSTKHHEVYAVRKNEDMGGVFFSANVSSAQRLSNGNILVCAGATGYFCELNENKELVWSYINPVTRNGLSKRGTIAINNQVFRCTFYDPSFKGFKNRTLKPLSPIEDAKEDYPCFSAK